MGYEDIYRDRLRTSDPRPEKFTMFNKTTETGLAKCEIGSHENITLMITGEAESIQINFYETNDEGQMLPFTGIRRSDVVAATGTTSVNEAWQFTVVGGNNFCVEIAGLTNGEVTITGKAV